MCNCIVLEMRLKQNDDRAEVPKLIASLVDTSADSPMVAVRRQPPDHRLAMYRLSDVSRLHWSKIGGGIRQKSALHVYGYVMCDGMVSGKFAHSCRHGPPPHRAKVCLTKKYNEKVWPLVLERAGPKPKLRPSRKARRRKAKRLREQHAMLAAIETGGIDRV
ncbi:hypothetical protein [Bradyrhizobium sp. LHD-71]|uniref:hypothetical protein n=1 Tax=Bradyrhizobium sp. LHD-71 TaxID=3072141 RepID=UPI00280E2F3E|nr:hypothetical protein [Bradyrhizobium sp. LHD-71]MDQ8730544.1 hypothetical protein [Bradyrhizobium sp. LHD-71]